MAHTKAKVQTGGKATLTTSLSNVIGRAVFGSALGLHPICFRRLVLGICWGVIHWQPR